MTEAFLSTSPSTSSPKPREALGDSECSAQPLDSQCRPSNVNNLPSHVFLCFFFNFFSAFVQNCNRLRVKVVPFTEDKIPLCFIGINYRSNLNWEPLYFVCFFLKLMTAVRDPTSSLTTIRKRHFYLLSRLKSEVDFE